MGTTKPERNPGPEFDAVDGDSRTAILGDREQSQVVPGAVTGPSRLYFLDWIRVLALLVVVVFHVFVGSAPDSPTFLPKEIATIFYPIPLAGIGVFFAVSGAASAFSLERRTKRQFVFERVFRLAIPFAAGAIILVPITEWLDPWAAYPDSFTQTYSEHFKTIFSTQPLLDVPLVLSSLGAWLWVLAFLFAFSMMGLPILNWLRSKSADRFCDAMTGLASRRGGLLLWSLPVMGIAAFGQIIIYPLLDAPISDLYNGWTGFLRFFVVFVLGAILVRKKSTLDYVRRDWRIALLAGSFAMGLVVCMSAFVFEESVNTAETSLIALIVWQLLEGVGAWSFVLVFFALGLRWLDRPGRVLSYFLGMILAFYFFHQTAINAVELFYFGHFDVSIPADDRPYPEFYLTFRFLNGVLVLFAAVALLLAFIELVVRPIRPLRRFLGVTRERVPGYYDVTSADRDRRVVDRGEASQDPPAHESDRADKSPP